MSWEYEERSQTEEETKDGRRGRQTNTADEDVRRTRQTKNVVLGRCDVT
jgi:hypothetical protein